MAQSFLSASPSSPSCFCTSMAQSLVSASPSCFSFRIGSRRLIHFTGTSAVHSSSNSNCSPSHALAQCRYSGDEECNSSCSTLSQMKCRGRRDVLAISFFSMCLFAPSAAFGKPKPKAIYDERRLLEQNRKIQQANNAPEDFPNFIREVRSSVSLVVLTSEASRLSQVVTSDNYVTRESGLIYRDFEVGTGECPKDGQQLTFHYIGYNESGRRIDSTYLQGAPAKIRLGNKTLVPGFEEGIRDMKPGGKRRIIIPPELGPPVGPSTFFSAKQFEVFDIELLRIQDCQRRTIGFYSDVVCS